MGGPKRSNHGDIFVLVTQDIIDKLYSNVRTRQKYERSMPEVCIKTGIRMDVSGMFRIYPVYDPCIIRVVCE